MLVGSPLVSNVMHEISSVTHHQEKKETSIRPKKICVVTGTRAEYGLLSGIMHKIKQSADLQLQLIASAAHLSEKHGMTVNEIISDGFTIDARVPLLSADNSDLGIAHSVAKGLTLFAEVFTEERPDCLLVLGDRYEILAAVQAALFLHIPIAHIHGGEVTEGAVDEAIRHAISKLSNLHFVAAEAYRQRLIQMGEQPHLVFNVGAPGVDKIKEFNPLAKNLLETQLGVKLSTPLLLVTYHPETWGEFDTSQALTEFFNALENMAEHTPFTLIWTGANADAGGDLVNQLVAEWLSHSGINGGYFSSLGSHRYLSLMKLAAAVVGNSSSGIIEAPAMLVPTVNIGERQAGRLRSASVIDCPANAKAIEHALQQALSIEFVNSIKNQDCAYGAGKAADNIVDTLEKTDFKKLTSKKFFDLPT